MNENRVTSEKVAEFLAAIEGRADKHPWMAPMAYRDHAVLDIIHKTGATETEIVNLRLADVMRFRPNIRLHTRRGFPAVERFHALPPSSWAIIDRYLSNYRAGHVNGDDRVFGDGGGPYRSYNALGYFYGNITRFGRMRTVDIRNAGARV